MKTEAQECFETHNVEITHVFNPGDVYVKPGECVRFVNVHSIEHSAVGLEREFNSGILMPGSTSTLRFDEPTVIPYTCGVHPPMVGVIVVSDDSGPFSNNNVAVELEASPERGNPISGRRVFNKCKVCHLLEKDGIHRIGPNLYGVFGRTSGTVAGYKFSRAMREAGITWNRETLSLYLRKPKNYIPGTKMAFVGLNDPGDVQDVISYIRKFMD
tara:strand:- start:1020 stop:1661 length:642 start_codon:yes stop_codon:yes gene_type:complete